MNYHEKNILLFTSLYPLPWQPNKATFNFQQYQCLTEQHTVDFLVPVPWLEFFKNIGQLIGNHDYKHVCYFPFFYIPGLFRGFNSFFLVFSIIISIVPILKLMKAKTVLASWAFPDGLACAWLKKLCKYRLYIQCLGSDVNVHSEYPFRKKLLRKSFDLADGVITVSKALQDKVEKISEKATVKTVYNGVNFDKFKPVNEKFNETSLIFIGNIIKTKGVYELVHSVSTMIKSGSDFHLHLVGNGPEIENVKSFISINGLEQNVTLHGTVNHDQVVDLLQKCHALILPSYREGVPNVIMEALACGVPVIATKVGGIPEVVNDTNGVLLNYHNEADIVEGIDKCLSTKWNEQAIRESIKMYTWDANVHQLSTFLFQHKT
jgi:glycosyltransferase involved in cell wall biosynthesis